MAISHCYWYLVVKKGNFTFFYIYWSSTLDIKIGNFTLLLTSSGQEWQFHIATDISYQEWQFHIATHLTSRMAIWHWLTSIGQEWQFHIATDIYWSRLAISHCYWHLVVKIGNFILLWHLVVKNGNFTLLLTSSSQEWQFHIATDI